MPTVTEAVASFEARASTARARYHKAVGEGVNPREARRVHDEARRLAFIDLVAQVRDRQTELTALLDEGNWRTLADANATPGYQAELENSHGLTRDFGARVELGRLWDLSPGPQQKTQRSSNDAMNDLIRGR